MQIVPNINAVHSLLYFIFKSVKVLLINSLAKSVLLLLMATEISFKTLNLLKINI